MFFCPTLHCLFICFVFLFSLSHGKFNWKLIKIFYYAINYLRENVLCIWLFLKLTCFFCQECDDGLFQLVNPKEFNKGLFWIEPLCKIFRAYLLLDMKMLLTSPCIMLWNGYEQIHKSQCLLLICILLHMDFFHF